MDEKKIVFSFDRDGTIDVNPLNAEYRAIPLEWVQYLAHETDHEVWAHGNQKLKSEAGIPGKAELIEHYKMRWGDPVQHVNDREHKDLEHAVEIEAEPLPDPDLVTGAAEWEKGGGFSKQQYLRLLATVFPEADEYICIDNQYLGYVSGWRFHYPAEFAEQFEWIQNEVNALGDDWSVPTTNYASNEQEVRRTIRIASAVGKRLPRKIRDRFELDTSKRIPVRFRNR